jgi:aspartyl-tRNA(Asn)/glutamyl-tRNA(Gln) amidotransferase subunit A
MPLSFSMDTVGPLARSVEDCAVILGAIAGADPMDPTASTRPVPDYIARLSRPLKDLRIGVAKRYFHDGLDAEIASLVQASLEVYAKLGARIVEIELPDMEPWTSASLMIVAAEAAAAHGNWMRTRPQDYSDQVRARLELGLAVPAASYIESLRLRGVALQAFSKAAFGKADLLHLPSVSFQTPTIAETDVGGAPNMMKVIGGITRLMRPGNFLGLPCLSVPAGFTKNGLPTAVQLMGRQFDEATLFAAGHAYQQATDWHTRAPKL